MARDRKTYFDGKELRDATSPLWFPVLPADLAAAKTVKSGNVNDQKRFRECLVAQSCSRVFGEDAKVVIMRRVAYVSLPNEKYAHRYEVPSETREIIRAFDTNHAIGLDKMIQLVPPTKSRTLVRMRNQIKGWREKNPEHKNRASRKTTRKQTAADPLHGVVRNGIYVRL